MQCFWAPGLGKSRDASGGVTQVSHGEQDRPSSFLPVALGCCFGPEPQPWYTGAPARRVAPPRAAPAAGDHDSDPSPEASQRAPSLRLSLSAVSATGALARTHALRRALLSEAEVLGSHQPPPVPGGQSGKVAQSQRGGETCSAVRDSQ